jgi:hypothetical protein
MEAKLIKDFLNEKFSSAENALRIDVRWTNKAKDLSEVKPLYITPRIQGFLDQIKTVSFYVLDQRLTKSVPGSLQERIFICNGVDGEKYLVNPEGWDYPRYTAHLVTDEKYKEDDLDEATTFGHVSNMANTTFGAHYPIDQINYENSEDEHFIEEVDELECAVCGNKVFPVDLENGLCKKCIKQGFWKDRQDRIHHGYSRDETKDKGIPTY